MTALDDVLRFCAALNERRASYELSVDRPEAIRVTLDVPGERWEIGLISLGTVLSIGGLVATGAVCLVPGLDVMGCGPAIAGDAILQSVVAVTSSRSPGEKVALVLTNALLANGATLFYATDELMAEAAAPGWVTGFFEDRGSDCTFIA